MMNLEFYPNLNPRQIIEEGAFGGSYFGYPIDEPIEYDYESLFKHHFDGLDTDLYLGEKYKAKLNKFGIRSGMDYNYWKQMGWIHPDHPRGWFHWYCCYEMGRRSEDDARQISRWQDFCGRNGRWRKVIYNNVWKEERSTGIINLSISPRIQQSLMHWGYAINEPDYLLWKRWQAVN